MATATFNNITQFGSSGAGTDVGWGDIGAGPGGGTNTDDFIEGVDSFGGRKTANGRGIEYSAAASVDMSTTETHLYVWINCKSIGALDLISNGGLSLRVSSTTGGTNNYRTFYIGGSDVTKAGWQSYIIDPTLPGSVADTGTFDPTSVISIGVVLQLAATVGGTSDNILMDIIRYSTGPYITGGTSGDRLFWSDIASTDSQNAYGIIQQRSGVYFVGGQLALGAPSATSGDCYLDDVGEILVWEPREYYNGTNFASSLSPGFNGFIIQEGTGTTDIEDGNLVGTGDARSGTAGSLFQKAAGGISGSDTVNSDTLKLSIAGAITAVDFHGTSFKRFDDTVTLSSDATDGPNHVYAGVVFDDCAQVDAGLTLIRNVVFSAHSQSITEGALLWNNSIDIKNVSFLANAVAVEHEQAGTFTYDNLTFSDNTYDILNTSNGAVTASATNGSNPSIAKVFNAGISTTDVATSNTLLLTGIKSGSEVAIVSQSGDRTLLASSEQIADPPGTFEYTRPYPGYDEVVDVIVHAIDWEYVLIPFTLLNQNQTVPIQQSEDRSYDNPT